MELRQLRYFVSVADFGSFSKAALILDIAQPALSRQVRELEAELGVSLLLRNGRGAILTDAGAKFLRRARTVLEDAQRAVEETRALKGRPMGMVAIGMPPSIGAILSVPTIVRVRSLYPEVQLQFSEAYSGHIHEWLLSGRLDVGVLYMPNRHVGADVVKLANERLYLLGRPADIEASIGHVSRIPFSRLPKLPLILPTHPHAIRTLLDEVAEGIEGQFNLALEVNAFTTIRELVTDGHGFTILPVSNVLHELTASRLRAVEIVHPELVQTVGLLTSRTASTSLATTTVARVIQDLACDMVKTRQWPESLVRARRV